MTGDVALHRVDSKRGFSRVYTITAHQTLFGEPCLTIVWGRMGSKLRRRTEVFPDSLALGRRFRSLLNKRRSHGYVTNGSPDSVAPPPPAKEEAVRNKVDPKQLSLFAST